MTSKGKVADEYLNGLLERYRSFPGVSTEELIEHLWSYSGHGTRECDVEQAFVAGYLTALKINEKPPKSPSKPDLDHD
jgi:hypothetical protein